MWKVWFHEAQVSNTLMVIILSRKYVGKFYTHLTVQVSVSRILRVLSLEIVSREAPDLPNSNPLNVFFGNFNFFSILFSSLL